MNNEPFTFWRCPKCGGYNTKIKSTCGNWVVVCNDCDSDTSKIIYKGIDTKDKLFDDSEVMQNEN